MRVRESNGGGAARLVFDDSFEMGVEAGMNETLDRLDEHLARGSSS
jgi:hypothetical protein